MTEAGRQEILDGIQQRLAAGPAVRSVKVRYLKNASTPPTVDVDVTVERSGHPQLAPVLDLAEREVWLSEVRPLAVISLSVQRLPVRDDDLGESRSVVVDAERERLTGKHGPRPV